MTQSQALPPSILEKLAATLTKEEYKQVMEATATKEDSPTQKEDSPAQIYNRLEKEYSHLHGVEITSKEVFERYGVQQGTIYFWVSKKWVRPITKGRGQGVQSTFDEGDIAVLTELNNTLRANSNRGGPLKGGWTPPARF